MKTEYRQPILSPLQVMNAKALDTQNVKHPVQEEIKKCIGTYNFTATISQDYQTLEKFRHVPGIISFICILKRDSEIIGEGRGVGVLSKINKYLERTVRYTANASFLDAVTRSLKMIDVINPSVNEEQEVNAIAEGISNTKVIENIIPITESQKKYLSGLIQTNIKDKEELYRWRNRMSKLTKDEASKAIQSFVK
jgi:hypothetical protein